MDSPFCRTCLQPVAYCGRSDRRAMSCNIRMISNFMLFGIVPCFFREKINEIADKWLVAETRFGRMFDLSIVKTDERTYICGPFWRSLMLHFGVGFGEVVRLECFEDVGMERGGQDVVSPAKVYVTVFDHEQNEKPRILHGGYPLFEVPSCVRRTLQNSVFADIETIDERNLSDIIWEMYKEVGRFYEGEFYHAPDLQYYIRKLNPVDIASGCLRIPKGMFRGYNCPRNGEVLFWNRRTDVSIWGKYRTTRPSIEMWSGFSNLCNQLMIGNGDVILVKAEVRDLGIALEVERIG